MKVSFQVFKLVKIGLWAVIFINASSIAHAQPSQNIDQEKLAKIKLYINFPTTQKGVDIDKPSEEDMKTCTFEKATNPAGNVVRDNTGRILRRFVDNNGDTKVDQLSFYKNGIEVYREIDVNGKGKMTEFRWLGPGGTRWGVDRNGDGKIDQWQRIGVEELVQEAFDAIKAKDQARFDGLLLTAEEFKSLELGEVLSKEVEARWKQASDDFMAFCNSQKDITPTSQFVNPTNGIPSVVAAGSYGNKNDILLYDHASVVFEIAKDKFGNLAIGTVVQVGNGTWRLIELPQIVAPGKPISNGNVFFPQAAPTASVAQVDDKIAKIHRELDEFEEQIKAASNPAEIAKFEQSKAELLEQLVLSLEPGETRSNTVMYAADSIISSYQEDRFPDGIKFLEGLADRFKTKKIEGLDYLKWRSITGRYNYVNLKGNNEERDKALEKWLAELMAFQKEFPLSKNAAEALCYLGTNYDNEGKENDAIDWYRELVKRFPESNYGKRAKGALARLDGIGEKLQLTGQDLAGNKFNLQDPKWRGKVFVIHYWETWCADGMEQIERLAEKYKEDVVFVGCNIDSKSEDFAAFMKKNPEYGSWLQLHAPGSIETSPLSQQLGIPSLPLLLLVNKDGELAEPVVVFGELDRQIERQRRK